jgi:hypothetical protein
VTFFLSSDLKIELNSSFKNNTDKETMAATTFTPEMLRIVQEDAARKLMQHLHYNADFTNQVIGHLFNGESSPVRPNVEGVALVSTKSGKGGVKTKRKYTKTPAVLAQRAFNATHKEEVLSQIKSDGIDSKKVAGTLSKRLAELWKASSEKAALKSGGSTPPSEPETAVEHTDSNDGWSASSDETFMLDLDNGKGEVECTLKNGTEVWSGGKHVGNKTSDEDFEIFEE